MYFTIPNKNHTSKRYTEHYFCFYDISISAMLKLCLSTMIKIISH